VIALICLQIFEGWLRCATPDRARCFKSARSCITVSLLESMLTLLEAIAFVLLVAISLAGFAAALAWTFAVWFGNRG